MSDNPAFIAPDSATGASSKPASPKPSAPPSLNKRQNLAKQIVVNNYNEHHDGSKTPRLTPTLVYVVSFTEIHDSWKALVRSTVVKGLLYEVVYNAVKRETTLEVYKSINTERFSNHGE